MSMTKGRHPRRRLEGGIGSEIAVRGVTQKLISARIRPACGPAVTLIEVSKLYGPDSLIKIEAAAAVSWAAASAMGRVQSYKEPPEPWRGPD